MSQLKLYIASVTGNVEIKKQQQKIMMILESKKIDFEQIDITADTSHREKMRELANDPKALAPQICNGDEYCGNYQDFEEAVENENLEGFLKLK